MKALFQQYARYNKWGHQRLIDITLALSSEEQLREIASSFPGLYKTFFHLWSVEEVWWERLHGEQLLISEDPFKNSTKALTDALLKKSAEWIHWIDELPEETLLKEFSYKNLRGESYHEPLFQVLQHIFNHGSYHHGQIVTIFHHLGVEKIPGTDFILWARENKS